jgi:S-DNA-T family DNA segregation ATPase FtsK/SpoIIIE
VILQKINQTINFLRENYKLLFATIFFFIFSFVLFLSLVSYNPIDLIEKGGKLNIFGAFGAKMAYHFVQYFGFASYFIVFIFLRFAFIFALNGFPARYKIRTFSLILSLILLCFLLGSVKKYEFTFYHLIGGYLGFLLSEVLQRYSYFSLILVVSFAVFLALTTFALNLHEIKLVRFFLSKIRFKIALPSTFKRKQKIAQKQEFVSQKKPSRMEAQAPVLMAQKVHSIIKYIPPSISLLALNSGENQKKNAKNLTLTKNIEKELSKVLLDFGIEAIIKGSRVGPVITMYEVEPKAGIRASRVVGLAEDISRSLKAKSARISLIPSSSSLAVEIPNIERETVFLREILDGIEYKETDFHIPIALGKSIAGDNIVVDLTTMPHLLVAGTTGSGKSVGVNAMILSILYKLSPNECQFVMIDPKMLELSVYNDIPHLITPVITESEKAVMALKWLTIEMEKRYRKMSDLSVRNIFNYNEEIAKLDAGGGNEKQLKKMPFIFVVIDEMADLMITAG